MSFPIAQSIVQNFYNINTTNFLPSLDPSLPDSRLNYIKTQKVEKEMEYVTVKQPNNNPYKPWEEDSQLCYERPAKEGFPPSTHSKHQFPEGRIISPLDLSLINVTSELPAEGDRRPLSWSSSLSADSWVAVDEDSVPSSSTRDKRRKKKEDKEI